MSDDTVLLIAGGVVLWLWLRKPEIPVGELPVVQTPSDPFAFEGVVRDVGSGGSCGCK